MMRDGRQNQELQDNLELFANLLSIYVKRIYTNAYAYLL